MATTITANGINFPDGSAGSPSIGGTDTNTGLFTGSDIVGFATGGSERLRIDASGNVNIANDSGKLQLGTSSDLKIYHNGTNSYVRNSTGQLLVGGSGGNLVLEAAGDVKIQTWAGENMILAKQNGAVELYYDNSKKFHTYSDGCSVFGHLNLEDNDRLRLGDSSDLQIYHDGSTNIIEGLDGIMSIRPKTGENGILLRNNGAVELYHDDSKKFETTSSGIDVAGSVDISGAGTLVSTGSTTQPLTFKNNGRTGTYNQSCMYAHQNNTSGNSNNGIVFEVGRLTDSSSAEIGKFTIATRGGNIATITDADGIKFNGDTAAANGLNDYEEGTWTPTSNTGTITVHNASYIKIGNLITYRAYISFPSMSGVSNVEIQGFPFQIWGSDYHTCPVNSDANLGDNLVGQYYENTGSTDFMNFAKSNNVKATVTEMSGHFIIFVLSVIATT